MISIFINFLNGIVIYFIFHMKINPGSTHNSHTVFCLFLYNIWLEWDEKFITEAWASIRIQLRTQLLFKLETDLTT